MATTDILFDHRGTAGIVTLNRPQALNALTHDMVRALAATLDRWRHDPAVTHVVLTAAGGRAFCAGGDIRVLYDLGRAGRHDAMLDFWRDEYRLNVAIKHYPKPYVALIDGVVMGGGVGISMHGSHRVAGDKFAFAMPEVGIGFFPDVGATWLLPRMPDELGTYCALTGDRLRAGDAVATGVASHRVASARFSDLLEALCGATSVDALLAAFAEPAGETPLFARRDEVARLFSAPSVEDILGRLDREAAAGGGDAGFAAAAAKTLRTKSPISLTIALEQMRRGLNLTFDECMMMEFRIVSRIIAEMDFYEGVRAVIIDKDNAPHWQPAELADVGRDDLEKYFASLDAAELTLPGRKRS